MLAIRKYGLFAPIFLMALGACALAHPALAQFILQGKLIDTQAYGNALPPAVALAADGNTAFVSKTCYSGCDAGRVHTFTRTNGAWNEGPIIPVGVLPHGGIGWALGVSEDGNMLIAGALINMLAFPPGRGAAWVLGRWDLGWNETRFFGGDSAVAIAGDGNTAIVGGRGRWDTGTWVYTRTGRIWSEQANITSSTAPAALSRDGNTAVVGNVVFIRANSLWTVQTTLPAGTFPVAVSADGNTVVVGNAVFTRANGAWTKDASLAGDGYNVAISRDGTTIVEGGIAFRRVTGLWTELSRLPHGPVALSGDGNTAVVGVPSNALTNTPGAVVVYVQPAATHTSLIIGSGNPHVFSATVTSLDPSRSAAPAGAVTFSDNGVSLPGGVVTLNSSGAATYSATLGPGGHTITAAYTPSSALTLPSTSGELALVVDEPLPSAPSRPSSSIDLAISPGTPSVGDPLTLAAMIGTANGRTAPAGIVSFFDGATLLGAAPVNAGQARITTSALNTGSHNVQGRYSGDGVYPESWSKSIGVYVTRIPQTVSVTANSAVSLIGEPVTFTARLSVLAHAGVRPPSGEVQFFAASQYGLFGAMLDKTFLGSASVHNGIAILTVTTLSIGSRYVVGTYFGDDSWSSASSSPITQTVTGQPGNPAR